MQTTHLSLLPTATPTPLPPTAATALVPLTPAKKRLGDLPAELIETVQGLLNLSDMHSLRLTCRSFKVLIDAHLNAWLPAIVARYQERSNFRAFTDLSTMEIFRARCLLNTLQDRHAVQVRNDCNVTALQIDPVSKTTFIGTAHGYVHATDLVSGKWIRSYDVTNRDTISGLAVTPTQLFSCTVDGTIRGWNRQTGNRVWMIAMENVQLRGLTVSHDCLFANHADGVVSVWNRHNGHEVSELNAPHAPTKKMINDPTGIYSLSNRRVHGWNAGTLAPQSRFYIRENEMLADAAIDGGYLYACIGKTVQVWNILSRLPRGNLAHAANITDIAVDGYFVYTSSKDGQLSLWEKSSGKLIYSLATGTLSKLTTANHCLHGVNAQGHVVSINFRPPALEFNAIALSIIESYLTATPEEASDRQRLAMVSELTWDEDREAAT